MLLSVVIPTRHRNDLLRMCLESLDPKRQTLDESFYEVIVSDDGSEFTAKEMIENEFPWCNWYQGPQKGPASNRNYGASCSKSNWIVFIDDDCIPDSNLLLNYKNAINTNPKIKVFEGLIEADRPQERFDEESPVNLTGGNMWSCNFMIAKEAYNKVGGFDENFPSPAMEDMDLRETLKKEGHDILFLKESKVIHPWRVARNKNFIKKHHAAYAYYSDKHSHVKKEESLVRAFRIYYKNWQFIINNMFKFKFRGFYRAVTNANYSLYLNVKHLISKK